MRNLKKLLAVIMVVAMLASIMVPALAADNETVAKQLQDLGLFKGYSDTELGLGDGLTREQALAFMLRVMGLEDEALAMSKEEVAEYMALVVDPETVTPTWAQPYVAYGIKTGLVKGIDASIAPKVKFDGQRVISGQEFVRFIMNGLGYTEDVVSWNEVMGKAVEVGLLSANDAIALVQMSALTRGAVVPVLASALTATTIEGITLAERLIESGDVDEDKLIEYGFFTPSPTPTEAPKVITATAYTDNLIQVYVEFSAPVDKDSAEDVDNYSLGKKVEIADAKLQDDGQTVVLTLAYDSSQEQQSVLDLTIDGVKDVDGNKIGKIVVEDIEFLDTTIPTVVDATIVGKNTIKVVFSEPMKGSDPDNDGVYTLNKNDFVVNNGKLYVKEVRLQNNYTEAMIELYSTLKEGEITLQVKSGSEDFAGFGVVATRLTLEVVPDEEAPVVIGYEKAKRTEVTLIWSEDIEFNKNFNFSVVEGNRDQFYHTNAKNPVREEKKENGKITQYAVKIDGNKMTLYFDDATKLPNGTAYVYVMKDAVKDYWDNKNSQQMIQVEVEVDNTPPSVEKVEVKDEDKIEITFSEELKSDTANKKANYALLDSKGEEIDNIIKSVSYSSKKVTVTFKEDLNGDYAIVIKNIEDLEGNKMSTETVPFTVGDETAPDPSKFEATLYNSKAKDQMIKINFKDVMATEGKYAVTDAEKYVLLDQNHNEKVMLEDIKGVEIVVTDDGKAVEIYVPSDADVDSKDKKSGKDYVDIDTNTYKYVRVYRVADAADHKMEVMYKDVELKKAADVIINKAEAVARDTIEVTFSAELVILEAEEIVIKNVAGDAIEIAGVDTKLKDGKTVAVFTLAEKLSYDAKYKGSDVIVSVDTGKDNDIDSQDRYNNKLDENTKKTVEDKIKPELYNDGKDGNFADQTGALEFVKDYFKLEAYKHTVTETVDGQTVTRTVYDFDVTIYFAEPITVLGNAKDDANLARAGNDLIIRIDGDELVNGKDYDVVDYGYVQDNNNNGYNVGFVTIRIYGKQVKEGSTIKAYKLEGDLSVELVDKPQYLMDQKQNAVAPFDAIELDNLEYEFKVN